MTTITTPRAGDVIEYDPDGNRQHCREGVAVAVLCHDRTIRFMDTYWAHSHDRLSWPDGDSHYLTETELATAVPQFNISDHRPATRGENLGAFEPDDVFTVSAQHGLTTLRYVRHGAARSNRVILDRQRQHVAAAYAKIASAHADLEHAERELARLELLAEQGEQL